jgi:hypothetical protein
VTVSNQILSTHVVKDLQALLNTFIFILCTPTFHSETPKIFQIFSLPLSVGSNPALPRRTPSAITYLTPQRTSRTSSTASRYTPSTVIPAAGTCSALVRYSTTDPPTSRLFPTYPLRINLATRCLPRATTTRHALHATTLSCSRFYTRHTSHSPLSALDSLCHRPVLPALSP